MDLIPQFDGNISQESETNNDSPAPVLVQAPVRTCARICNINARSVNNKFNDIKDFVEFEAPDIITFSETWESETTAG